MTVREAGGVRFAFWLDRTSGRWQVECTQRGRRLWVGPASWMRERR